MLSYTRRKEAVCIRLTGELDHRGAQRLRTEIDTLLLDPKIKRLEFDLSGLSFMDSSGIGFLIGRYKQMVRRGGSVGIARAEGRVNRILEMAGLYQIIDRLA